MYCAPDCWKRSQYQQNIEIMNTPDVQDIMHVKVQLTQDFLLIIIIQSQDDSRQ